MRDYHSRPELSTSQIVMAWDNPELYHAVYIEKSHKPNDTPEMEAGRDLENALFESGYQKRPIVLVRSRLEEKIVGGLAKTIFVRCKSRNANEFKDLADEYGKDQLCFYQTYEDRYAGMHAALANIASHEEAASYLFAKDARPWHVCLWRCPWTGLERRAELDLWVPSLNLIVDVKRVASAYFAPQNFVRHVRNFKYHWQRYAYIQGMEESRTAERPTFRHIVSERTYPYRCAVYELREGCAFTNRTWDELAESELRIATENYQRRIAENDWNSSYCQGIEYIDGRKYG